MLNGDPPLRVFVSSTSDDLQVHRAVSRQVIGQLRWLPVMMEDFGASTNSTVKACREEMEQCQLVLLIMGFRRGWVPGIDEGGDGVTSITALELQHARACGIPVLPLMANTDWPMRLVDDDEVSRRGVQDFRKHLNQPAEFFAYEDVQGAEDRRLPGFREIVRKVLLAHKEQMLAGRAQASAGGAPDYRDCARDFLFEASCVPVIGLGIFGDGPLGSHELARALGEREQEEVTSLATVAEYRERQRLTRPNFLNELARIVAEQSRSAAPPKALQMLLGMPSLPPLIVAATYDQLLEDMLTTQGRNHVVVTHIVRTGEGEQDGRILVLRPGQPPLVTTADKVDVGTGECVVYRPLGSPLVHARLDPSWAFDTVVITETDHSTFLGRLENEFMTVPTRFNSWLRRRPLMFLGYGLDLWNYRLFMHVFRVIGERKVDAPLLAIRNPKSEMEAASWERLGAKLVRQDTNEFAEQVMSSLVRA